MGYSYTFKDIEPDFSDEKWISYWDFMLLEFFKASKEDKDKFRNAYIKEYGVGPYNHMMRNYWYAWERGNRTLSDTQSYRIYCLMPALLKEEAIHKIGANEFIMSIKSTVRLFIDKQKKSYAKSTILKTPQDVIQIFKLEFEKIKKTTLSDYRIRVLTDEEQKEALYIAQYILETKLQKSYDQIERDFNVFLPYMSSFNRGVFSASYTIASFNLKVDIKQTTLEDVTLPKFYISEIESNSNFKQYADKYLAYELVNMHSQSQKAVSNAYLNAHDIKLFFDHYEELSLGESEVNMKSTFNGEGGTLSIQAQMKPLKMIKASFLISITKLIAYSILVIGIISIAISYKLVSLLIFASLFTGGFIFTLFKDEIKQLKILKIQIKQYGQ